MMTLSAVTEIRIARWVDRFLAWLIDFAIVTIAASIVNAAILGDLEASLDDNSERAIWTFLISSFTFLAYWTVLEYLTGQSVGKKILRLRTVDEKGNKPHLVNVLLSSFGKAFLLPLDVLLGWIFTNTNKQRIFNRISYTLVVKISRPDDENIKYEKD